MNASNTARPPYLVLNIIAQIVFGLLAMTICLPSLPFWSEAFGESQDMVQLTFSGFVVTYGGFQLLFGPWSDQLGRKKVLIAGLVLALVGTMVAATASQLTALIFGRLLQGAGCAASMVVSRAMVQDHFVGSQRTQVMAFIGMAMGLCPPTATVLGGHLHVWLGWQANFYFIAVLAVILMLAAWKALPESKKSEVDSPRKSHALHWGASYFPLLKDLRYLLHVCVLSLTTATFYIFLSGAPLVLNRYGVSPDHMGYYIMCIPIFYIFGNYFTSQWVKHGSEQRLLLLGQSLTLIGLLLMLVLAYANVQHPLAMSLPLMILGLGHGMLMPTALAGTIGIVPGLAGSAAALAGLLQQLMGAWGGYLVGFIGHESAMPLGLLMLGATALASACLWGIFRNSSQP